MSKLLRSESSTDLKFVLNCHQSYGLHKQSHFFFTYFKVILFVLQEIDSLKRIIKCMIPFLIL